MSLDELARTFADCDPYRLHVAYDGSGEPGKPGWTYLNFSTPLVPGTFIWFTVADEPRPPTERRTGHRNDAVGVTGLVFDLRRDELSRLSELAGASSVEGVPRLGGLDVWTRDQAADLHATPDKTFPLVAVVLEAASLDHFLRRSDGVVEITFVSEPALLVRTNRRSWDLLIRARRARARGEGPGDA